MRSWRRALATLAALLSAAVAEAQWVYVLRETGEIAVINPAGRTVQTTVHLSRANPDTLYPTPGGKYVLVTYRDSADMSAVDVEQHAETRSFVLEGGRASSLTYSPMGDTVLTTQAGSGRIDVWAHSRSQLDHRLTVTAGVPGTPALFNRRATRLYRSTPQGLAFVYLKTGEVIGEVSLPGGPMSWGFTPDYRDLWGVALGSATVAVVDETRTRLVGTVDIPHRPHPPVFSPDGGRVFLIDATARSIIAVDTRSRKEAGRIALPTSVTAIAAGGGNELWAMDPAGVLYVADTGRLAVQATLALGGGKARQMSYITLKRGEGYACF